VNLKYKAFPALQPLIVIVVETRVRPEELAGVKLIEVAVPNVGLLGLAVESQT
jgi:hypothetical protein